jgi:hypothetical protein
MMRSIFIIAVAGLLLNGVTAVSPSGSSNQKQRLIRKVDQADTKVQKSEDSARSIIHADGNLLAKDAMLLEQTSGPTGEVDVSECDIEFYIGEDCGCANLPKGEKGIELAQDNLDVMDGPPEKHEEHPVSSQDRCLHAMNKMGGKQYFKNFVLPADKRFAPNILRFAKGCGMVKCATRTDCRDLELPDSELNHADGYFFFNDIGEKHYNNYHTCRLDTAGSAAEEAALLEDAAVEEAEDAAAEEAALLEMMTSADEVAEIAESADPAEAPADSAEPEAPAESADPTTKLIATKDAEKGAKYLKLKELKDAKKDKHKDNPDKLKKVLRNLKDRVKDRLKDKLVKVHGKQVCTVPNYVLTATSSTECPPGYELIEDNDACRAAGHCKGYTSADRLYLGTNAGANAGYYVPGHDAHALFNNYLLGCSMKPMEDNKGKHFKALYLNERSKNDAAAVPTCEENSNCHGNPKALCKANEKLFEKVLQLKP